MKATIQAIQDINLGKEYSNSKTKFWHGHIYDLELNETTLNFSFRYSFDDGMTGIYKLKTKSIDKFLYIGEIYFNDDSFETINLQHYKNGLHHFITGIWVEDDDTYRVLIEYPI